MADKKYVFLNTVKTPFGDVVKGEILTGRPFTKKPSEQNQGKNLNGFVFNFYENKDRKRFLDKTVDEIFFIPSTALGEKGTIREAKKSDNVTLLKPKPPVLTGNTSVTTPLNESPNVANKSNKMISFVIGALAGVIVGYVVLKKLVK